MAENENLAMPELFNFFEIFELIYQSWSTLRGFPKNFYDSNKIKILWFYCGGTLSYFTSHMLFLY